MKLSGIHWLFFDLGSTLIDEEAAVTDCFEGLAETATGRGLRVSAKEIEEALAQAFTEFSSRPVMRMMEILFDSPEDRAYLQEQIRYRKELDRPYPGVRRLLSRLSSRYRIGVIANQPIGTEARLAAYGLDSFMSLCLASAELGLAKPDPAIFELALEQAGCKSHQAVMIGDRIDNDIRPAKALGWKTIHVLQGSARNQVPREPMEEADFIVRDLTEILDLLEGRDK